MRVANNYRKKCCVQTIEIIDIKMGSADKQKKLLRTVDNSSLFSPQNTVTYKYVFC